MAKRPTQRPGTDGNGKDEYPTAANHMTLRERLAAWTGEQVVIDCVSPYVAVGTLKRVEAEFLELVDADMHDLRDTSTTREMYVVKTAMHGVLTNRRTLLFRTAEVVGIARLSDVPVQ